jgi:hypothetical protein
MRNIVFVLTFLISFGGKANTSQFSFDWIKLYPLNDYSNFDWTVLPQGFTEEMALELIQNPIITTPTPITVMVMEGELIAALPCRFDLLKWNGTTWVNLYLGPASGFNCKPHFFVQDGKLYSYGTYGFWKNHSELLEFDFEVGGWENVQVDNLPVDYGGNANFISGNKLLSLFGNHINQSSKKYVYEQNGYYLDLQTKKWIPLKVDIPNQEMRDNMDLVYFDLKDFGFIFYFRHLAADVPLAIDKSDHSIHALKKHFPRNENQFVLVYAKENKLWIYNEKNGSYIFNLKEDISKFEKVGNIVFDPKAQDKNNEESSIIKLTILFIALIIMGFSLFFVMKKKQTRKPKDSKIPSQEIKDVVRDESQIISQLVKIGGKMIKGEEFDVILGINTIQNPDTKRVMRSKYIKSINGIYRKKTGVELVTRIKSEGDKRIMLYSIAQIENKKTK